MAGWILEVDRGALLPYEGNYSSWLVQKQKRLDMEHSKQVCPLDGNVSALGARKGVGACVQRGIKHDKRLILVYLACSISIFM